LQNLRDPEVRAMMDGMVKGFKEALEKQGFTSVVCTEQSEERVEVSDHRVATRGRRRSWCSVSLSSNIFLWT